MLVVFQMSVLVIVRVKGGVRSLECFSVDVCECVCVCVCVCMYYAYHPTLLLKPSWSHPFSSVKL